MWVYINLIRTLLYFVNFNLPKIIFIIFITYRKNNNLITAIKLKNVHALIANETKNQRDSLFKLEYVNCKMISNYEAEGIIVKCGQHILSVIYIFFFRYKNK